MRNALIWCLLAPTYGFQFFGPPAAPQGCPVPVDTVDYYRAAPACAEYARWLGAGRLEVAALAAKPVDPARGWTGRVRGDTLRASFWLAWDADANGWIDLADFAAFGKDYARRWRLGDLVRFGRRYDGPARFDFYYRRCAS
jgi:hypothetical protein